MRLPRFRLRTLMIVVATVAVAIVAERTWRLSGEYRKRAKGHAVTAWKLSAGWPDPIGPMWPTEDLRTKIGYFRRLERKYDRAARYPWLSVPPDPPEPK